MTRGEDSERFRHNTISMYIHDMDMNVDTGTHMDMENGHRRGTWKPGRNMTRTWTLGCRKYRLVKKISGIIYSASWCFSLVFTSHSAQSFMTTPSESPGRAPSCSLFKYLCENLKIIKIVVTSKSWLQVE